MTKQKTIKERARELLKKLEVHYKVKDKVHYRDLVGDKNLTLITKALQDTIKDTEERVIGEMEKALVDSFPAFPNEKTKQMIKMFNSFWKLALKKINKLKKKG